MDNDRNILKIPIVPQKSMKKLPELCREIGSHGTPVYIPFFPENGIERHDCMKAVKQKISRDGGRAHSGWLIWQWANIILEATVYTVWQNEDGSLLDVTPKEAEFKNVLFIPAPNNTRFELKDKRIPITNSILSRELIEIANVGDSLMEVNSCLEAGVSLDKISIGYLSSKVLRCKKRKDEIIKIVSRKAERNESCPCGSGIKYKKCCGYYSRR